MGYGFRVEVLVNLLMYFVYQDKAGRRRSILVLMIVIDKDAFKCTIWLTGKHTESFHHSI